MVLKRSDNFKRTFWCPRILPKQQTNEFVIVVKTNTFVRFLGEFEDTQSTFVIIWPLEDQKTFFLLQFLTYYSIHVGSITLKSSDLLFCFSFYRLHISLIYPVDFFAFFRYQKKSNVIFLTRGGVWGFGYFTCENCVKNCVIWQKCSISLLEWCGKNEA